MSWITDFFTSSIGRKIIMSLTGIFLILFLLIHLIGNLQLLAGDGGEAFNVYAYFMTHNPLIKSISYGLYFFILLHSVVGILLWWKNNCDLLSMSPIERWRAAGPLSEQAQDRLAQIVVGSDDESEQWTRFEQTLTAQQQHAFRELRKYLTLSD